MSFDDGIAAGLKVIEIGSSVSVALAGMTLADAGAEVVMLEPPGGSPLRDEQAFAIWGRGKRSVVCDLSAEPDRAAAIGLLRQADVLLIGLKPASLDRLDLTPERVRSLAPELVYAGVTGFGRDGPYRDVPVYDAVMQARGGRMYEFSTLHDGTRPAFAAAPVVAFGAAMALVGGVFGALRARAREGGGGRLVETSLARALTIYDLAGWMPGGPPPLRLEDVPFLPYAVARTADGVWIQFAQNGPALFADFLRVLGLEGEIDYLEAMRPAADNSVKRSQRAKIQQKIAEHTWDEWRRRFADERNLSAEPFHAPGQALAHDQFEAIGDVVSLPDVDGRPTRQLGPVFDVPARPLRPRGPAPRLGAHEACFEAKSEDGPRITPVASSPGPGLLAGVTVLELGMWIALPFAATQLAELGARVIKLEPLAGDPMRTTGPVAYKIVQGKESLAIDLKRPEAREIVHRLVERADVVLHSYRPGVPERLGINFATLREINPRLVYLYNGSYGSRGPKSYAPAFHVTGGAVAGGAWAQAGEGCPPPPETELSLDELARVSRRLEASNEANPDFNSAVAAAAAVAMGLYARERTGEAIEIETRMMLSNAMMMSADFVRPVGPVERGDAASSGPPFREVDAELDGLGPLYRLYRASDGWLFLAVAGERDFQRLCEGLGLASIPSDARFATAAERSRHAEALVEVLSAAIVKQPADALEAKLAACGVACVRADEGPYSRWLFEQTWACDDGVVVDVAESIAGPYRRYGASLTSGESVPLRGAFAAGADTRALLDEVGFTTDEIEGWLAAGVVAVADARG